jgi:hypothetical protein
LQLLLNSKKTNHEKPNHAYQIAFAYDWLGNEREVIPFYQKVIKQGLN